MARVLARGQPGLPLALFVLLTLVLLIVHAVSYTFLIDDAFISFRYARNLSNGHGLVFNPGWERVEGYTNFLWVLILAAFDAAGVPPESVSHVLTLSFSMCLWGLVVWYAYRYRPEQSHMWIVIVPPLFLAMTRSVAVWSTGGLETRLFELLVLAGALRLIVELESLLEKGESLQPFSALLLGMAAITRPEGMLMGACALAVGVGAAWRSRWSSWKFWLAQHAIFFLIVSSHFVFRRVYYEEWLPNTYYAKVGTPWWSMGARYTALFALEYSIYLWAPLIVAAIVHHWRRRAAYRTALFAAIVIPHLLYVISIGGDHFEYRPLSLYFPFAYLLLYDGAKHLLRRGVPAGITVVYLAIVLVGLVAVPYASRIQFPTDRFRDGFPGIWVGRDDDASRYLDPESTGPFRLPGLRLIGQSYVSLLRETTGSFVGLRAEEHSGFLETVVPEGISLGRMVDEGRLPADTYIAIDCIGAIPYYSGLRTLDRLGLTDKRVARTRTGERRLMAHSRHADIGYARDRGVDFWAMGTHLLWKADDPRFQELVTLSQQQNLPVHVADLGDGWYLMAVLLQGPRSAQRRFPTLTFQSLSDPEVARSLLRHPRPGT